MGFRVNTSEHACEKDFRRVSKEPGGKLAYLYRFPEAIQWVDQPTLLEQMVSLRMVTVDGFKTPSYYTVHVLNFLKFDDRLVSAIARTTNQDIPNLHWYSDKVICEAIIRAPNRMIAVKFPSEKVLMAYASQRYISMKLLLSYCPSEKILLRAVMTDGSNISEIANPSRALMEKAVRKNGENIQYIKNPPDDIVWMAVAKSGMAIKFVQNPSEELQRLAVSRSANAITVIDNPIPELQVAAVEKSPNVIRLIKNPDEDAMWKALEQKPNLITTIKNVTPEMESFAQIVS